VYGEASGEAGPIVWSPDGRWLAFDTLGGIYVIHPNGNGLRLVSAFPGHRLACYDLEPSWRPNGRKFVLAVLCDGGNMGLWTVGIDGRHRRQLLSTRGSLVDASQPAWSPNGRRIAFVGVREKRHHGYAYDLYTIRPDGSGLTRLTNGPSYPGDPAWSPQGARISFTVSGGGVFVMNPNGTHVKKLRLGSSGACCLAWNPNRG
jgi:Tol biopolymer transport system component